MVLNMYKSKKSNEFIKDLAGGGKPAIRQFGNKIRILRIEIFWQFGNYFSNFGVILAVSEMHFKAI